MKRLKALQPQTNKEGGEFFLTLYPGDCFLSFHGQKADNVGYLVKRSDLNDKTFSDIYKYAQTYFGDSLFKCEMKIIGLKQSINLIGDYFFEKKIINQKHIEKNGQVEVLFLPSSNKVRVSIEPIEPAVVKVKIKVLIVDDSKTIRTILSRIFETDSQFEVCAMAEKPSQVESLILKHKPDVITLDIHMPEMDGVTLLKTIISPKYQVPTVMISSISMAEGPMVLDALENGAVDYIQKPELSEIEKVTPMIIEKVRIAALSNTRKKLKYERTAVQTKEICNKDSLIVLGSSTGGTEAIRDILTALPNEIPPMLIVQHIPAVFSLAFAKRMNDLCPFEVKEAEDGDEIRTNRVLVAPGGQQMKVVARGGKHYVEINDDAPVNRFKPSVDYMFLSVSKILYTHTIAVILTGMGKDGAKGMLELKKLGVRTIAQDEESSVVFGMPKEAINIGAAEYVEPLSRIAEKIALLTSDRKRKKEVS